MAWCWGVEWGEGGEVVENRVQLCSFAALGTPNSAPPFFGTREQRTVRPIVAPPLLNRHMLLQEWHGGGPGGTRTMWEAQLNPERPR